MIYRTVCSVLLLQYLSNLPSYVAFRFSSAQNVGIRYALHATQDPVNSDGINLEGIYKRLKVDVLGVDDGVVGIESRDSSFGIEIVKAKVKKSPGLGIELVEVARGNDGRGLVLIGEVSGNALETGKISTGDTLTYVGNDEEKNMIRVEGQDYDSTIDALLNFSDLSEITLVLKRLVKRQPIAVTFEIPSEYAEDGTASEWKGNTVDILAGSNLRGEMIRMNIPVYDKKTKRFDQPYATGNCGGEGICGTCFVEVKEGSEFLSKPDGLEKRVMQTLPVRWRLSCRTIVGNENKTGKITLRSIPQSTYVAERKRDTGEL